MNDSSYYLKRTCTFVSQKQEGNKYLALFSILREVVFWNVCSFPWEIEFFESPFQHEWNKAYHRRVIVCVLQRLFLSTKQETDLAIFHWKSKTQIMNVLSDELSILRTITYRQWVQKKVRNNKMKWSNLGKERKSTKNIYFCFYLFCSSKCPHNVFFLYISFIRRECCWHSTAVVKIERTKPRKRKWKTHQTSIPSTLSWWKWQHTLLWDWREVGIT